MLIEFDLDKDAANRAKHGLPLSLASELDWDTALIWMDRRFEYGEERMIALAARGEVLYYVAFVERAQARRIISLRRANRREVRHYVENF
ncbi:MAG: BrnT family toxin [Pseudomonadota bacterium]